MVVGLVMALLNIWNLWIGYITREKRLACVIKAIDRAIILAYLGGASLIIIRALKSRKLSLAGFREMQQKEAEIMQHKQKLDFKCEKNMMHHCEFWNIGAVYEDWRIASRS